MLLLTQQRVLSRCSQNLCSLGFQNLEPNDRLLASRDLPIFNRIFSKKDCLSPFLSAAKPIPLDRGIYPTTPLHWIHTKIPKIFLLTQKMIVVLPHKCLFCFAIFLCGGAWWSIVERAALYRRLGHQMS